MLVVDVYRSRRFVNRDGNLLFFSSMYANHASHGGSARNWNLTRARLDLSCTLNIHKSQLTDFSPKRWSPTGITPPQFLTAAGLALFPHGWAQ